MDDTLLKFWIYLKAEGCVVDSTFTSLNEAKRVLVVMVLSLVSLVLGWVSLVFGWISLVLGFVSLVLGFASLVLGFVSLVLGLGLEITSGVSKFSLLSSSSSSLKNSWKSF